MPTRVVAIALAILCACAAVPPLGAPAGPTSEAGSASAAPAVQPHAGPARPALALPVRFEPNVGQAPADADFVARDGTGSVLLSADRARLLRRRSAAITIRWLGARPTIPIGERALDTAVHRYARGSARSTASYAAVRYRDLYPGVDLVFHSERGGVEFDFVVAPGADPDAIALEIWGARALALDARGALVADPNGVLLEPPRVFQRTDAGEEAIDGRFVLEGKRVRFALGPYDRAREIVVDPKVVFASYLGGQDDDAAFALGVDAQGNAYVAGITYSFDLITVSAADGELNGPNDLFVAKIDGKKLAPTFVTYLGGSGYESDWDGDIRLAVDEQGAAYVAGSTNSVDFPTTPGALVGAVPGGCPRGFVTKLAPTGTLAASTYLAPMVQGVPGCDVRVRGVAVRGGAVVVTGHTGSDAYPTTPGVLQPSRPGSPNNASNQDGFVTTLDAALGSIVWSTYFGGGGVNTNTRPSGIAVADDGTVHLVGHTTSPGLPVSSGAFQPAHAGAAGTEDIFVARLAPDGSKLLYASYLGGVSHDFASGIALDASGNAFVTGHTENTFGLDFPTTENAFQPATGGSFSDAVVAKISPAGELLFASYLGGGADELGRAVAVDAGGAAYIGGTIGGIDFGEKFPSTLDAFQEGPGGSIDGFVTRIAADGASVETSSRLGGSGREVVHALAVDAEGFLWVAGASTSDDLALVAPFQAIPFGSGFYDMGDAFIARIAPSSRQAAPFIVHPSFGGAGGLVTVHITGDKTKLREPAEVRLRGAGVDDVVAQELRYASEGAGLLEASFDLRGAAHGPRDVVLVHPGGASETLPEGFLVEAAVAPRIWADLLGHKTLRGGKEQLYRIVVGNQGNVDAFMVPVHVALPKYLAWKVSTELEPLAPASPEAPFDEGDFPLAVEDDQRVYLSFLLPVVRAASGEAAIDLWLTAPTDESFAHQTFSVETWANQPQVALRASTEPKFKDKSPACEFIGSDCYHATVKMTLSCLSVFVPGISLNCWDKWLDAQGADLIAEIACAGDDNWKKKKHKGGDQKQQMLAALVKACGAELGKIGVIKLLEWVNSQTPWGKAYKFVKCGWDYAKLIEDCSEPPRQTPHEIATPLDPNEKVGAARPGSANCVSGAEPLRYAILFENKAQATAAAQEVVVTDQLDPAAVDLDGFAFGPVTVGDRVVATPALGDRFHAEVDLRPERALLLAIDGRLERETGLVTWRFASLDPATGKPTEDPLAGFLPPDKKPPEGQGSVMFTVPSRAELAAGARVENLASIVFDKNAPIVTPVWLNTMDREPPRFAASAAVEATAESEDGVPVAFAPVVSDDCPDPPAVACDPAAGTLFPVGTTRVRCVATDPAGNETRGELDVVVREEGCGCRLGPRPARSTGLWLLGLVVGAGLARRARDRQDGTEMGTEPYRQRRLRPPGSPGHRAIPALIFAMASAGCSRDPGDEADEPEAPSLVSYVDTFGDRRTVPGCGRHPEQSWMPVPVPAPVPGGQSWSVWQSLMNMATIRSSSCLPRRCVSSATSLRRRQTSSMAADSVAEPMAVV